jgi:hypothetical protein
VKKPREDLRQVLAREDVRELGDARQTEAPVPNRLDDLGKLPHQLRCPVPVESGAPRQPEVADEEVEKRVVPEIDPPLLRVEGRERDEKVCEGEVLAAKEVGEDVGQLACGAHEIDPLTRSRGLLERTRIASGARSRTRARAPPRTARAPPR